MMISSFQATMGRELALRTLSHPGPLGLLRRWRSGKLVAIADIYIPYRLYKITVDDRRAKLTKYYAVDAAAGLLDLYEFTSPPPDGKFVEVETRNFHPVRLGESETKLLVLKKARRSLFARGFFHMVDPVICAEFVRPEFYMPYWAGFYGDGQNVRVTALDAVRHTVEGSKVSEVVKLWLMDQEIESLAGQTSARQDSV